MHAMKTRSKTSLVKHVVNVHRAGPAIIFAVPDKVLIGLFKDLPREKKTGQEHEHGKNRHDHQGTGLTLMVDGQTVANRKDIGKLTYK